MLPPVESQGLLTTKAPLWVTSSLLPILAAASVNPPSLSAGKPIYLGSLPEASLPACALWQLYWLYCSVGKEEARAAVYCSAQKTWSCFWCLALPMLRWSNLLSAFWILAIAQAHLRGQRLQEDSYPLCICSAYRLHQGPHEKKPFV